MPVSKHNLWKRKKNGVMKLVRSHSDWLQKRLETKTRKKNDTVDSSQWWEKDTVGGKPTTSTKVPPNMAGKPSSAKRTQVGKKI